MLCTHIEEQSKAEILLRLSITSQSEKSEKTMADENQIIL